MVLFVMDGIRLDSDLGFCLLSKHIFCFCF
jgi:hypothetical protein